VAQQSVTYIIPLTIVKLATPKVGAKHELLFNKPDSFEYEFMLSCSFTCGIIHLTHGHTSNHTLLCCLSPAYAQQTHLCLLNKSSCLAAALEAGLLKPELMLSCSLR
jgi:hypothetical protein